MLPKLPNIPSPRRPRFAKPALPMTGERPKFGTKQMPGFIRYHRRPNGTIFREKAPSFARPETMLSHGYVLEGSREEAAMKDAMGL